MVPSNKFIITHLVLVNALLVAKALSSTTSIPLTSNITNTPFVNGTRNNSIGGKASGSCYCNCPTCSSSSSSRASGCFASNTLVTLANGQRIPVHQLQPNDQLLTTDGKTISSTNMMMMLDKNSHAQTLFHTLVTASGHNISLTKLHLIPIVEHDQSVKYIPAKDVKVDDMLYVMSDDNQMMLSPVRKVILETKIGFYAPLTTDGTLLVNGIMASCYSNVKSHEAAQWWMGPLRWYYWMAQSMSLDSPFGSQNTDGMHFIPSIMYEFGRFFRPTTLRFN